MHPAYLRAETTLALFGLTRLIEAEETIARILSRNIPIKISDEDLSNIEQVLDHAAVLLNRPDFKPNKAQRQAVFQAFQYRFTIITGSPGTGKTAIVALICAAAALISGSCIANYGRCSCWTRRKRAPQRRNMVARWGAGNNECLDNPSRTSDGVRGRR